MHIFPWISSAWFHLRNQTTVLRLFSPQPKWVYRLRCPFSRGRIIKPGLYSRTWPRFYNGPVCLKMWFSNKIILMYSAWTVMDRCGWWLELAPLDESLTDFDQYLYSKVQCLCTPWSRSGSGGITPLIHVFTRIGL